MTTIKNCDILIVGGEDLERVQLDREKSYEVFQAIRELGIFFGLALGGVAQNPDFAAMSDFESFKEDCTKFEEGYENIKKEVEELFSSATPQ